jgi:uncharacterized membrane protein HdeD (DUF308 family)
MSLVSLMLVQFLGAILTFEPLWALVRLILAVLAWLIIVGALFLLAGLLSIIVLLQLPTVMYQQALALTERHVEVQHRLVKQWRKREAPTK